MTYRLKNIRTNEWLVCINGTTSPREIEGCLFNAEQCDSLLAAESLPDSGAWVRKISPKFEGGCVMTAHQVAKRP